MNSSDAGSEASLHPRSRRKPRDLLNSFFTSKASHINDYYIDLDEPHKQFGPGDTVSGRVVLDVSRPLGITHVSLSLFGYVEVFKSHSTNKSRTRTNASRTATGRGKRWVSEYYGDGFASLFEDELVLCGDGRLDPKLYHFRFEIDFPSSLNLPSSIDVRIPLSCEDNEFVLSALAYLVRARNNIICRFIYHNSTHQPRVNHQPRSSARIPRED